MNWEAFWFVLGLTLLGVALCVALAALAFWLAPHIGAWGFVIVVVIVMLVPAVLAGVSS